MTTAMEKWREYRAGPEYNPSVKADAIACHLAQHVLKLEAELERAWNLWAIDEAALKGWRDWAAERVNARNDEEARSALDALMGTGGNPT